MEKHYCDYCEQPIDNGLRLIEAKINPFLVMSEDLEFCCYACACLYFKDKYEKEERPKEGE